MRQFVFTASILTSFMISSCAQDLKSEAQTSQSPKTLETAEIAQRNSPATGNQSIITIEQRVQEIKARLEQNKQVDLSESYKTLDPQDISRLEILELMALQKEQSKRHQNYRKTLSAWRKEDPATRGPQPKMNTAVSEEDSKKLRLLNHKVQKANLRKRYEAHAPKTLTIEEAYELVTLEQAQQDYRFEQQEKIKAWGKQNPATRGPYPTAMSVQAKNTRLQELQGKIQSAKNVQKQAKSVRSRINRLKATHNISISDDQINELTQLTAEKRQHQSALQMAIYEHQKQRQLTSANAHQSDAPYTGPQHLTQRMTEIDLRINAIQAPLKAAENANRIRKTMTRLSQQSGILVLPGEIDEAIALNAEKDRIHTQTQHAAKQKQLLEGGSITHVQAFPNDEDYVRLKEINARIKEISAPMQDAKNAVQDAQNPALRQRRLQQEERAKWNTIWQDKKQAGEIPRNARLNSPSYAELQDRVEDYSTKLKSRAAQAGYSVKKTDISRLDTLNKEMLTIRKTVYDMEVDGSSMTTHKNRKTPSFKLSAGMYKVQLIEKKQREILAGLTEAETYQNNTTSLNHNFTAFNRISGTIVNNGQFKANNGYGVQKSGAESMIENLRKRGIKVSQEEADDLLAFERDLEKK